MKEERISPDFPQYAVIRIFQRITDVSAYLFSAAIVFMVTSLFLSNDMETFIQYLKIGAVIAIVSLGVAIIGTLSKVLQNVFFVVVGKRVGQTWFVARDGTLEPVPRGIYGTEETARIISLSRKARVIISRKEWRAYSVVERSFSWVVEFRQPITVKSASSFVNWINSLSFIPDGKLLDNEFVVAMESLVLDSNLPFSISRPKYRKSYY